MNVFRCPQRPEKVVRCPGAVVTEHLMLVLETELRFL